MITGSGGKVTQQLSESKLRTPVGTFEAWTLELLTPKDPELPRSARGSISDVWYDEYLLKPELPMWLEMHDGYGSYQVLLGSVPVGETIEWSSVASAVYVPEEF